MAEFPVKLGSRQGNADLLNAWRGGFVRYATGPIHYYRQVVRRSDFTGAAALTQELDLMDLFPHNAFLERVQILPGSYAELLQTFSGGAVSACTIDLGDTNGPDDLLDGINVFTGQSLGLKQVEGSAWGPRVEAAFVPTLTIATVGANISALTQGAIEVFIPFSPLPR